MKGVNVMRFMMLMIPKGYEKASPDALPPAEEIEAMMKYNERLQKAGVLISLNGLHPQSAGARVIFSNGKPTVSHGPFDNVHEVLGGYWMIDVKSQDEAVEWASHCPVSGDAVIEIRQIQEFADFPDAIRKIIAPYQEMQTEFSRH
jgi:hypothetical protein